MKLADLRGRLTLVLTPELRAAAFAELYSGDYGPDRDDMLAWFDASETPDGTVLDAAYSESEALMIQVLLRVALNEYDRGEAELDDSDQQAEEAVRTLSRY